MVRERGFVGDRSVLPSSYPYFERIIAATDGTLWVYRNWAGEGAFDVFDANGRYLAEVPTALNAGLSGTHPSISGDHIAGVRTDSLDVPYVQVHRIRRE